MFEEQLANLSDEHLQALRRESELGELNFTPVVDKLRAIRRVVEALGSEDPLDLPAEVISGAAGQLNTLQTYLEQMEQFTINQDQAASQRQTIEAQVEAIRQWFTKEVRPHLRGTDVDTAVAAAALAEAQTSAAAAAKLVEQIRQRSGEAGATELSGAYHQQSKTHEKQSWWFLIATIVGLVAIVLVGLYLFVWHPLPLAKAGTGQWEEFTRGLIVRVFFLSVIGWALGFVSRNYRVAKHLQVVNEQKRNALNTYVLFTQAAPSAETQNIITAELVHAVFATTESGFLGSDGVDKTIIENQPNLLTALRSS